MDDYGRYTYDEELIGEAPCEFCGELFPLMLLIEHQSIHLMGDDAYDYALLDDNINNDATENILGLENLNLEPKIAVEEKQTSDTKNEPKETVEVKKAPSSVKVEPRIIIVEKPTQNSASKTEKIEMKKYQDEKINEFTIMESGENLLTYGTDIDPDRDLESEKGRIPNNPLLSNLHKVKDEEDINNLSDDDSSESLEEFWKRARDFLKRNRGNNEC